MKTGLTTVLFLSLRPEFMDVENESSGTPIDAPEIIACGAMESTVIEGYKAQIQKVTHRIFFE